ncbi:hypothetical protein BN440_3975 [Erwinia amylovora MR1]|nr:hypothetical protein BN440_3975 [Erwinia amylovora MR1]
MTMSFTLGLEQVQNELIQMKTPGCYWVMVNRQQDARLLVRQTIAAHTAITLISHTAGANEDLLPPIDAGVRDRIALFSLPDAPDALNDLTQYLSRGINDNPGLLLFCAALSTWDNLSADQLAQWLKGMQQWLARKQLTMLVITEGGGVDIAQHDLHACYRTWRGCPTWHGSREAGITAFTGGAMAAACWPTACCLLTYSRGFSLRLFQASRALSQNVMMKTCIWWKKRAGRRGVIANGELDAV